MTLKSVIVAILSSCIIFLSCVLVKKRFFNQTESDEQDSQKIPQIAVLQEPVFDSSMSDIDEFFASIPKPFNITAFEEDNITSELRDYKNSIEDMISGQIEPFFQQIDTENSKYKQIQNLVQEIKKETNQFKDCKVIAKNIYSQISDIDTPVLQQLKQQLFDLQSEKRQQIESQKQYQHELSGLKHEFQAKKSHLEEIKKDLSKGIKEQQEELKQQNKTYQAKELECKQKLSGFQDQKEKNLQRQNFLQQELDLALKAKNEQEQMMKRDGEIFVYIEYNNFILNHQRAIEVLNESQNLLVQEINFCENISQFYYDLTFRHDNLEHIMQKNETKRADLEEKVVDLEGKLNEKLADNREFASKFQSLNSQIKQKNAILLDLQIRERGNEKVEGELMGQIQKCLKKKNEVVQLYKELERVEGNGELQGMFRGIVENIQILQDDII